MAEGWRIEGRTLTITLDGPAAGTYTLPVPAPWQHPQAGAVIQVGIKADRPVLVKLSTRPTLATALDAWTAAERERALTEKSRCTRCGQHVDGHTAYRQTERSRWGKVLAYYCDSCATLLCAIGAGEHSAMDERAGERPDMTPETKEN